MPRSSTAFRLAPWSAQALRWPPPSWSRSYCPPGHSTPPLSQPSGSNWPCHAGAPHRLRRVDADYIVVGTGSAGSVVANRLSADPSVSVVVLEAGPRDKDKFIHIPAGFAKLFRSDMDWNYLTEPQKELDGREIYWPRGKVLGGSSSMNAMMWVRGFPADYDEWAEHAGEQWSYANVEPYLNHIERGPLVISPQRSPRSSTAAWLRAVAECIDAPEGFCETRVTQRRGARWSTADAYLKPAAAQKSDVAHGGGGHAGTFRRVTRVRGRI